MGGTLWLKSSSGPKSLPPAGVLLPAFETNRVSVCGGTTIERDSHLTGRLACNLSGCIETRNLSEKIVKPARIVCMTPDGSRREWQLWVDTVEKLASITILEAAGGL